MTLNQIQASNHSKEELSFNHTINAYDVVNIDNIIHLIVYCHNEHIIFHYTLDNGNIKKENEFEKKVLYGYENMPSSVELGDPFLKLDERLVLYFKNYDCFTSINLRDSKETNFLSFKRKGEYKYPIDVIHLNNNNYLIYSDNNSYKKYVIGVDEIHRGYSKDYLYNINYADSKGSGVIQEGRFNTYDFKYILSNDTLYAIWQISGKKSFSWLDFVDSDRFNKIVMGQFDGVKWHERIVIVNSDEPKDQIDAPIGIYKIKNKIYFFWDYFENSTYQDPKGIYFKVSADGKNWSNKKRLSNIEKFFSCIQDENEYIHLLANNKEHPKIKYYYIFDGTTFHKIMPVIENKSYSEKIILMNEKKSIVFWKSKDKGKVRLYKKLLNIEF